MKLTIPEIRDLVGELTEESKALSRRQLEIAQKISELMEETRRRSYKRAPVTSRRITPAVRVAVRAMHATFPEMSHQALAEAHDINIGRVSEILHGKR